MDSTSAKVQRQRRPPPSPDVWDMPPTPPRDPNDLASRYPLPTTPTAERYAHVNFWGLLGSPISPSGSMKQSSQREGEVDIRDFSRDKSGKRKRSGVTKATFGRDRENDALGMKLTQEFFSRKRKLDAIQLTAADGGIVNQEASRPIQLINQAQYQALDEKRRRRFQLAYENKLGAFYAAKDVAEPVERIVRARWEEWGELARNRNQHRRIR
ncbi:hypothetical protein M413DRAFT_31342 [Hebeloma cylindrosporum]|uniref:Uncharacterized protein n=1 Tax=Hebeloma cylindrosporum TaxID=76867 RepID=A0A0C2XGB2_HEBCY|nr:hypothetical protein M413DRAFT_31342 [Hebeloma cylindrosporum h7]